MKYNGYSNYETWMVNLWLGEDLKEVVRDIHDQQDPLWEDAYELAKYLKDWVHDWQLTLYPEMEQGSDLFIDLLRAAMQDVNWRELTNQYMEL